MTNILRVYIAGPCTAGDVALNVRQAVLAGLQIQLAGHLPFIPHFTRFFDALCPHNCVDWSALDLRWLKACDCVLRLPGESPRADRAIECAKVLGLPIYHDLETCLQALPARSSQGVYS